MSCFPKNIRALQHTGKENGVHFKILQAVEEVNNSQKNILLNKVTARFGNDLEEKRFAIWGLAFKPGTNNMRGAPSRVLMDGLWARGAHLTVHDPVAVKETLRLYGDRGDLRYAEKPLDALHGADALIIATEWTSFKSPDFIAVKARLKHPVVFDGRNLFDPASVSAHGLEYHGIGRRES